MTGGPEDGPAALELGQRVRIAARRRGERITLCVEHCVLLAGTGVFVSGWLLAPRGGLRSLQLAAGDPELSQPLSPSLARPEILDAHSRQLKRGARRGENGIRPGFWDLIAAPIDRPPAGLRLVVELDSGESRSLALPTADDARAILRFLEDSGLYSVAGHLPTDSSELTPTWRDALFRLAWLLPAGSIEHTQLESYLEHGRPLAPAELGVSYEAGRGNIVLPPPETMQEIRDSGLFDERHYRGAYPELVAAGSDPLTHYFTLGHREGRDPSGSFSTTYYRSKYLAGDTKVNPLVHYHETGAERGYHTQPGPHDFDDDVFTQIRHWAAPGEEAEDFDPAIAADRPRRAKLLAFYLPQFHAIPENDEWWGKGFTEWRNLMRGMPRFAGHYQPRIPRDLGFYDLGDPELMRRQAELARAAGVHGFCFYYYRFNRKRVLERPIDRLLEDRSIDLPFCLIWANENWTRRWDGAEDQILLRQNYDRKDDDGLIDDIQRHFDDPRYIRIDGRPLLLIYRIGVVPRPERTLDRWRELWRDRHGEDPLIFIAQTFEARDPREFGADGAVEFPPHKVAELRPPINQAVRILDPSFSGYVYDYDTIAMAGEREPYPDYDLVKGVVPSWDNDARRQGAGVVLRRSSPGRYEQWLRKAVETAEGNPVRGERMVFVNAWNEWAEGAYLEPDVHYGAAYLNATARAVCGS